jgi:hypothetical protein
MWGEEQHQNWSHQKSLSPKIAEKRRLKELLIPFM